LDVCLAVCRALDFPALVRIHPRLMKYSDGAGCRGRGVVVPHVDSVQKQKRLQKLHISADSGRRGFAGSTRWAGFYRAHMGRLDQGATIVGANYEEPRR
jgi:hypothetical protein